MKKKIAVSLFALISSSLTWAGPSFAGPDCECVAYGTTFKEGSVICIRLGEKSHMARCEMSQNNTMWRKVGDVCPTASLQSPFMALEKALKMSLRLEEFSAAKL
ncbi:MAG: hypothetical protein JKY99_08655 [Rhizobiales bacterium]|nr:hypothetical protein [Hyphomicrobiales bacterium]